MSQNSIIAFALLVGFVVFITIRGELGRYLAVVGLSSGRKGTAAAGATGSAASGLPALPSLPVLV